MSLYNLEIQSVKNNNNEKNATLKYTVEKLRMASQSQRKLSSLWEEVITGAFWSSLLFNTRTHCTEGQNSVHNSPFSKGFENVHFFMLLSAFTFNIQTYQQLDFLTE